MSTPTPRILLPVDGSAPSIRAVDAAVRLAQGLGAELDIVSVLDLLHVDPFEGYGMSDEQFAQLQVKHRDEILLTALERVPPGGPIARTRLLRGPALKTLLKEAEGEGVELVVLGRTGKGVFERLVQGSVASGMAAHAAVPVVIVP